MKLAPQKAKKNQTRIGFDASAPAAPSPGIPQVPFASASDASAPEPLLTVKEIAPRLFLQPRTAALWARTGRLPGYHIGRKWGFKWSEVENCLRRDTTEFQTLKRLNAKKLKLNTENGPRDHKP